MRRSFYSTKLHVCLVHVCQWPHSLTPHRLISFFIDITEIDNCEDDTCSEGNCINLVNNVKCICNDGYEGENCTEGMLFVLAIWTTFTTKFSLKQVGRKAELWWIRERSSRMLQPLLVFIHDICYMAMLTYFVTWLVHFKIDESSDGILLFVSCILLHYIWGWLI